MFVHAQVQSKPCTHLIVNADRSILSSAGNKLESHRNDASPIPKAGRFNHREESMDQFRFKMRERLPFKLKRSLV